ncbi:precorrin-8X methylmutase [Alkalibacter mobilis]|uniref:precorrin-8X methylmutase n=1 Tax=Alkalibacter mobilis TaxID=2787712 RepID=UPI00189FA8CB|nr:precorrin-8X methylmutase [Alkalibacter mobilis]MBF7097171.1 precorrin-8X methylmutase [Alkalibacter mobilis]
MSYVKKPMEIEDRSFDIIEDEMNSEVLKKFSHEELMVVKRVIHTTADFQYGDLIEFIKNPIEKAKKSLAKGIKIYADTNMIKAGVNPRTLKRLNCEIVNFVADNDVIKEAGERGVTRSIVSMEKACKDPNIKAFLIGNAPTALYTLAEHIKNGLTDPDFVVAVPVGFVGAEESKNEFSTMEVPSVVVSGRKGGSTVAVAVLNAILYLVDNER